MKEFHKFFIFSLKKKLWKRSDKNMLSKLFNFYFTQILPESLHFQEIWVPYKVIKWD